MTPEFIHLHLHTEYSISDGLVQIDSLIEACVQNNMPAVAVTDQMNLFGMVKFYRAAMAAGIKPIIGVDVYIDNPQNPKQPFRVVFLCQNQQGYKNVTRLISKAYLEGQHHGLAKINKSWLTDATAGIIVLAGQQSDIGQALLMNNQEQAEQLLTEWCMLFPDRFYFEIQRTQREHEEEFIHAVIQLVQAYRVPVVASNGVRFLNADDFEAHEARVCIHDGYVLEDSRRPHLYSPQQYFRTTKEMQELFADLPEVLINSVEIAKRCNLELSLGEVFLPKFPVPNAMTIEDYFSTQTKQGLEKRLEFLFDKTASNFLEQRKIYDERLAMEIAVINKMGFAGYFLIVADFIAWSKANNIPVGPGRGSGAGSLAAYALGITDLDPITHDLLFERFLNPERVSMPDFDIDFCMEGRDRVIDYVAEKYGRDSVSQIITYGTMAARAVVRDVGRVLGLPYGMVDKLAKLIPFEIGMTLKNAMQQEEQLLKRYQEEEDVKNLIDLALKLEGVTRNAGKHAGGVVIAPSVLTDFTPLYCEEGGSNLVTQFDKDDVEAIGLVKFDFLGLRTLTIIHWAVLAINAKRQAKGETALEIERIPLDDLTTYQLLQQCQTTAVFQLESRSAKDLTKRLQPNCFNDIVDLGAIIRPGALGMVDDFVNRKNGKAKIEYYHPLLAPVLQSTRGIILYQEQVMQIAQVLAGYSLGKADLLRRAMGKKKPEEMAKHRAIFMDGAIQRGVDAHTANQIFDLMEKFAGYGFNRSHSAAYAVITYQTAWLKAHYPAEFMAAVLSSDMDNTDKVVIFIEDCKNLGLKILPPDINHSLYKFTVDEQGRIVYGLGAIKGMGEAAVENILAVRKSLGKFTDLFSFCQNVDTRKVNRRVLESLIKAGAMDSLQIDRAVLMGSIDIALQAAEQHTLSQSLGQVDLFGGALNTNTDDNKNHYVTVKPWTIEERLQGEKETLGLYLSGHPISQYEKELAQFITARIVDLKPSKEKNIVAGLVMSLKIMNTKSGNRIAFLTLDDRTARVEVAVFTETFNKYRELLNKDQILVIEGEVTVDEFTGGFRMMSRKIYNLDQARENYAKSLYLQLHQQKMDKAFNEKLQQALLPFRGGNCPVYIGYMNDGAETRIALGDEWKIRPLEKLLQNLQQLLGKGQVLLDY